MRTAFIQSTIVSAAIASMSLVAVPALAAEGIYGVTMGNLPDQFGCTPQEDSPTYYRCESLPDADPRMEFYLVQSTPATGICWVKGVGRDLDDDAFGSTVKVKTDDIAQQLSTRYGRSTHSDFLTSESEEGADVMWLKALLDQERYYSYSWETARLPNNLRSVYLSASAVDDDTSYVVIEYAFWNSDECDAAKDAADED